MSKIRVLLADNHERILTQARSALGEEFEVVGSVSNGLEALAEVRRLDPDVLVTDISMPILGGFEVASRLKPRRRPKIVFLTVHEDEDFVAAAFASGASAYVVKSDVTTDLGSAIRNVVEGSIYISKSISR